MNHEEQMQELLKMANYWLKRTHIGRTSEEKQAYLQGLQDSIDIFARVDIFKDLEPIEQLFYPD